MSVASPNRPAFEFCDVFSVGSRLNPNSQGKVRDVPALQTLRISAGRPRVASSSRPAPSQRSCSSLPPADRPLGPPQVSTTLRALILKLSTTRQAESHI